LEEISPVCQTDSATPRIAASSFQKRGQLFIGLHNETLSVVAMGVSNPHRSPVGIIAETQPPSSRLC
jgi:hypothetical protein